MRNEQGAADLIDTAYVIDTEGKGALDIPEALKKVGVMTLHIGYYDAGVAQSARLRSHMEAYPDGVVVQLIKALRDARLDEYTKPTLNRMYGLKD